jgi:hypothetical protein
MASLQHLSTYGEREVENVARIIKSKPTHSYGLTVNSITSIYGGVSLNFWPFISININVDFTLPIDLLGIPIFTLKLPSLPKLPSLNIPDLNIVNISATIPIIPPNTDVIAIPTGPIIEVEFED